MRLKDNNTFNGILQIKSGFRLIDWCYAVLNFHRVHTANLVRPNVQAFYTYDK